MPLTAAPKLMRLLLAAGTALAFLAPAAAAQEGEAGGEVARLYRSVAEISSRPLPSLQEVLALCPEDALCAGEALARSLAPYGGLRQVATPSSDAIRGVENRPSLQVGAVDGAGRLPLRLHRFGRDVVWELRAALDKAGDARGIVLDLRDNGGGDFDRMLRVAGLFCGGMRDAVRLRGGGEAQGFSVPGGAPVWKGGVEARIGPQTASSAEVLAALLKRCAGARLLGERSLGKDVLLREVAVRQGWRLLVPAGRLEVDGVDLSGGLVPDGEL